MKRFLYYDQDSINSLLAQMEQGLLVKEEKGEENEDSFSSTTSIEADLTGDLSAKVCGIGAALKGDIKGGDSNTDVASNLVKNIQEKVLHDYSFEKVFFYFKENNLLKDADLNIGDMVFITEKPTFFDFNYFLSLFSENGAIKFNNEQEKASLDEKIKELKESSPNGGSGLPPFIKVQIENLKKQVSGAENERKEMLKTIEVIRNTLPYDRFVMTKNMLIPLDDKNFRDDPKIIAFKYGGEMSLFGYVTNIISSEETSTCDNDFAPVYEAVNKVMLSLYKQKNKIYVIHPITIYY